MNENEPKVILPEPPVGHRWEYRGNEWGKDSATFCYQSLEGKLHRYTCTAACEGPGHYWEAVPTGSVRNRILTESERDEIGKLRIADAHDFAQQAKDIIQKKLFPKGDGTFRDTSLDAFVDLIIKAAKQ